ncbi:Rv3235 family protein [Luteococcus sp. Sow4_B9]|uniref:Rv3235 family protein n=1 Tax=Luteococcus sp. Sow4_B9 TaxID=3438792 RepID=UPI003F94E09A
MRPHELTIHGQRLRLNAPLLHPTPLPDGGQPGLPLEEVQDQAAAQDDARPASDDARRLVAGLGRALLEVLQGRRNSDQAAHWMSEDCLHMLRAWSRQHRWAAARITGVRSCRVDLRIIEGTVLLTQEDSQGALMLRVEHAYGRWRVTVFEVLRPPALTAGAA